MPAVLAGSTADSVPAIQVLEALRAAGAELSVCVDADTGASPLHKACASGCIAVTEYLLKYGVSCGARDNKGRTPLHVAAASSACSVALLRTLVDAGGDPRAVDAAGVTPLRVLKDAASKGGLPTLLLRYLEGELSRRPGPIGGSVSGAGLLASPPPGILAGGASPALPRPPQPPPHMGSPSTFAFGGPVVFGAGSGMFTGALPAASVAAFGVAVATASPKTLDFSDAESRAKLAELARAATEKEAGALASAGGGRDDKAGRLAARGKGTPASPAAALTAAARAAMKISGDGGADYGPAPPPPPPAPPVQVLPEGLRFFTLEALGSGDPNTVLQSFEDVAGTFVHSPASYRARLGGYNELLQRVLDAPCANTAAQSQQQKAFTDVYAAFTHRCMSHLQTVVSEYLAGGDALTPKTFPVDGVLFQCSLDFKGNPGNVQFLVQELVLSVVPGLHVPLCAVFDLLGVRVVAMSELETHAKILPVFSVTGRGSPHSPASSPDPVDITGTSEIVVNPDSHPVFVRDRVERKPPPLAPREEEQAAVATPPPMPVPTPTQAPVAGPPALPDAIVTSESQQALTQTLGKAVEALLKKSMDTYPQPDQPPATLQADAAMHFKLLSNQVFQSTAMTIQPWLASGVATVIQGDDGRLYLSASSLEGCVPRLPPSFADAVPCTYVPGDARPEVGLVTLPAEAVLELIASVREQDGGDGVEDVTDSVSASMRAAVEAVFVSKGCQDDGEFTAFVCDWDSDDAMLLFTRPGEPGVPNVRLDTLLSTRFDSDVSDSLVRGVADAVLVFVNPVYWQCPRYCRPELLPNLCKAKDLGSVDGDTVADMPPSFVATVLAKTVKGLVGRLEASMPPPGSGVRGPPLQHVALSLKQSFHGAGLNLRHLGIARQHTAHALLRSALLCDIITRSVRAVLRLVLRCEDVHNAADVVRRTLRQLWCLPRESVMSPDSEAGDDSPATDNFAHLDLKNAVLTCFPQALSEEEIAGTRPVRPVFDTPRLRKSLWHQLGEEEQRVIMFQLQRLLGVQMTHSFHPDTQELVIKDVVFPGRSKSLRYFTQLTLARQNFGTSDGKRFFHMEVTKLMKQVIRRASIVPVPEPLFPSLVQLSHALSHSAKTLRLAHGYGQRTCELASNSLKAEPGNAALKQAKVACYRHLALLSLRWYKYADAEQLCKKIVSETSTQFGKGSVEALIALTMYGYALLCVGGDRVPAARSALHSVWTLLQTGTSELSRELHALAGSNYVASLFCGGNGHSGIKILQDLAGKSTQRAWTAITSNLGVLLLGLGDPLSSSQHLELVVKSAVTMAGEGSVDAIIASILVMTTMIDSGRTAEVAGMADVMLARCKRGHIAGDITAKIARLAGEACLAERNPRAVAMFQFALGLLEARFGASHPTCMEMKARLAHAGVAVGETVPEDGITKLRECADATKVCVGEAHPSYGRVVGLLAEVLTWLDETDEAVSVALQAHTGVAVQGKGHPEAIKALCAASTYAGLCADYDDATTHAKAASEAAGGLCAGHPARVRAMFTYARVLKETGSFRTASDINERECLAYGVLCPAGLVADMLELRGEVEGALWEEEYEEEYEEEEEAEDNWEEYANAHGLNVHADIEAGGEGADVPEGGGDTASTVTTTTGTATVKGESAAEEEGEGEEEGEEKDESEGEAESEAGEGALEASEGEVPTEPDETEDTGEAGDAEEVEEGGEGEEGEEEEEGEESGEGESEAQGPTVTAPGGGSDTESGPDTEAGEESDDTVPPDEYGEQ